MLEVRLLGQFDVRAAGKSLEIPSRPAQTLLAYLLVNTGAPQRREKLAGLLWPDASESNARSNLRHALWRIRKALETVSTPEHNYITADDLSIAFEATPEVWLDVAVLERKSTDDESAEGLIEAVSLYRDELLPGFYDDWVVLERQRLQAVFELKMQRLLDRLVKAGRWPEALDWGERWIALGHIPEPAYRALMAAHYALGDRAAVGAAYQRCVEALRRELDAEPSDETQSLYRRLANGEGLPFKPSPDPGGPAADLALGVAGPPEELAPAAGDPPFKGLQYFDEADAHLFFGREAFTARLVARLTTSPTSWPAGQDGLALAGGGRHFLAVVGASGSGKSSLVRAGLIPALRKGVPLPDGSLPASGSARRPIHVLTPTAHPLEALAASLTRDSETVTATATLMDDLARDSRSLHLYVRRLLSLGTNGQANGGEPQDLVLIVDQFEELFTLCRDEAQRCAFIDNLLTAAGLRAASPPKSAEEDQPELSQPVTTIVITLRADFYAHCAQYDGLREALARNQEYIGPMSAEALRRAIEGPAQQGEWIFEPGLVDLLLQDVGDEPGALPLLSHALLETWRQRRGRTLTFSGYSESGRVQGAIAQTADRVLQGMEPEQQAIARSIFLRLTELGEGTQDTRRQASPEELTRRPGEKATVEAVLKTLADARLITVGQNTVEVAHEALIREWPTLQGWLHRNRADLRLHRHLTETAQAWEALDREPGELYRGARLSQASEWAESHAAEMNVLEREFLAASQELARRQEAEREAQRQRELEAAQKLAEAEQRRVQEKSRSNRRLRWLAAGLAIFLVAALILAMFAIRQSGRAEQQARLATARELAAAAISNLDIDPERSILLALQSVDVTRAVDQTVLPEAANALHRALPASRVQLTLTGHTAQIWGLAYSPECVSLPEAQPERCGARLATGSDDKTAKLWDVASGRELLTLEGHTDVLNAVAFSPDGKRLATASFDQTAKVWDTATGQEVLTLTGHSDGVTGVAYSPDGTRLATASNDQTAKVWDARTGQELLTLRGHTDGLFGIAFSPDGTRLATSSLDDTARLWDADTGQELLNLKHPADVLGIAFSPDGRRLATAGVDATVRVWDVQTGEELLTLSGHTNQIQAVAFSPDGTHLATASADGKAIVWDATSGAELVRLAGHAGWVLNVAFSPDGTRLVTSGQDGTVKFWDWASPSHELFTLAGHTDRVYDVAFSPDGARLATTSFDETARVWDAATGRELFTLPGGGNAHPLIWNYEISFSPDGTRLTTVGADGRARVWDAATGKELLTLAGHSGQVWHVTFSPDGKRLATGEQDGRASVWDATTGQELFTLSGHTDDVGHIIFSPDGTLLATASNDRTARLWDAATGQELRTLEGHTDQVIRVAFSPDGTRLATVGRSLDKTVRVWDISAEAASSDDQGLGVDATSSQEPLILAGHSDQIWDAVFSPDSKRLVTASSDGTVKVWDVATGQELLTLVGHSSSVWRVAFSPECVNPPGAQAERCGLRLATASGDGTARLWDPVTGEELLTLTGHTNLVTGLAFSPDGTRLATSSDDGTVRVYVLPIGELADLARSRLTRTWTLEECQQYLHRDECPPTP